MRDQLLACLRDLADGQGRLPSPAELAARAAVPESCVHEHLGSPENYAALLAWPVQSQAQETRERILQSAAAVFARKGFERATLDAVAADAGMTKGAIYWHFKSKNDLFFALLDQRFQAHTSPLKVDLASVLKGDSDPKTGMLELLRTGMQRCVADPAWAQLYLECLSLGRNDDVRARLSAFYDQVWAMSASFTRDLQTQGLAPADTDPHTAAIFWTALFDGLVLAWLIKGGELDMDRSLTGIFNMLWKGLAPSPASSAGTSSLQELSCTGEQAS